MKGKRTAFVIVLAIVVGILGACSSKKTDDQRIAELQIRINMLRQQRQIAATERATVQVPVETPETITAEDKPPAVAIGALPTQDEIIVRTGMPQEVPPPVATSQPTQGQPTQNVNNYYYYGANDVGSYYIISGGSGWYDSNWYTNCYGATSSYLQTECEYSRAQRVYRDQCENQHSRREANRECREKHLPREKDNNCRQQQGNHSYQGNNGYRRQVSNGCQQQRGLSGGGGNHSGGGVHSGGGHSSGRRS